MSDTRTSSGTTTPKTAKTWAKNPHDPPMDGSPMCPACPGEIRNLMAVVHNYINVQRGRSMSSDTTLEDVERALADAQVIADAHFADSMHAYGRVKP